MNEEELINDFDEFIKKWCKENYVGHLLDNDDNDGEDFRDKLRGLFQKGKLEERERTEQMIDRFRNLTLNNNVISKNYIELGYFNRMVDELKEQLQKEIGGMK